MDANYSNYFNEFDKELEALKSISNDILVVSYKMIEVIESKLKLIHKWLKKHKFNTVQEEIYFFKELKPRLVSKLIYYKTLLKIETSLPPAKKGKIKQYEKELDKIHKYAQDYKELYEYYRSRASFKDEDFFVRRSYKNILRDDCWLINYDSNVCTSHDYSLATIIANDMLTVYLENKLEVLNGKHSGNHPAISSNLNWTGSKIDLTELVYALHHSKTINSGHTDVKDLAMHIGKMFNMDIEDNIYRTYQDIKSRKTVKTKFLNSIAVNLNQKMDEEDF